MNQTCITTALENIQKAYVPIALFLKGDELTLQGVQALKTAIIQKDVVSKLTLNVEGLNDDVALALCEAFMPSTTLTSLTLQCTSMSDYYCLHRIFKLVQTHQTLRQLSLKRVTLTGKLTEQLIEALNDPRCHIEELESYEVDYLVSEFTFMNSLPIHLSLSLFHPEKNSSFVTLLQNNAIKKLACTLTFNASTIQDDEKRAEEVLSALSQNTTLTVLDLAMLDEEQSQDPILHPGTYHRFMQYLSKFIVFNSHLTELKLDFMDNGFQSPLRVLATTLGQYTDFSKACPLKKLVIERAHDSNNMIVDGICAMLRMHHLDELMMDTFSLKQSDTIKLLTALKENTTLKVFRLHSMEGYWGATPCLDDTHIKILSEILTTHTSLTKLALNLDGCTEQGLRALGEALKQNTTLLELEVTTQENLDNEMQEILKRVLEVNHSLIRTEGIRLDAELEAALDRNRLYKFMRGAIVVDQYLKGHALLSILPPEVIQPILTKVDPIFGQRIPTHRGNMTGYDYLTQSLVARHKPLLFAPVIPLPPTPSDAQPTNPADDDRDHKRQRRL